MPIAQKPTLTLTFNEISTQTYSFKSGSHQIAVKVVDNEDLENIEVVTLNANSNGVKQR